MIYPELYLQTRENITRQSKGIEYKYNSRGFRDEEWPDNIQDCIFIVGSSTVLGYGLEFEDILSHQLQRITNRRVINISLYSASNDWILRKVLYIKKHINPLNIITSWVYFHFAEDPDTSLSDEDRRIEFSELSSNEELLHFRDIVNNTPNDVIQTLIKQAHYTELLLYLPKFNKTKILDFPEVIDYANDKKHYGPKTTYNLAVQLSKHII